MPSARETLLSDITAVRAGIINYLAHYDVWRVTMPSEDYTADGMELNAMASRLARLKYDLDNLERRLQ